MEFVDFDIAEYVSKAVLVVPIILGVTEAIKLVIPTKWSPLVSLGIGVGIAFATGPSFMPGHNILAGLIYGLSASGLYSSAVTLMKPSPIQEVSAKERNDNV